jgi:hypothetical protein
MTPLQLLKRLGSGKTPLLSQRGTASQPAWKTSPLNPTQLNKSCAQSVDHPLFPRHDTDYIGTSRPDRTFMVQHA